MPFLCVMPPSSSPERRRARGDRCVPLVGTHSRVGELGGRRTKDHHHHQAAAWGRAASWARGEPVSAIAFSAASYPPYHYVARRASNTLSAASYPPEKAEG